VDVTFAASSIPAAGRQNRRRNHEKMDVTFSASHLFSFSPFQLPQPMRKHLELRIFLMVMSNGMTAW
jgi:hypothetical protein